MRDYTKAGRWQPGAWLGLMVCVLATVGIAADLTHPAALLAKGWGEKGSRAPADFDFSNWHWPVPAGDWLISRGPCGSGELFTHPCGYYEEECAFDLIPVAGNMMSVPVLAPQAGRVFFVGTRTDTGLAVLLQHDDGRVSELMHLSKVVVALDQSVRQGQVVGYAGRTGYSGQPHIHFDVQTNAVERSCLPITGIDELDNRRMTIVSHNLPWTALTLPDPPPSLPVWLPLVGVPADAPGIVLPAQVVLAPLSEAHLPVAMADSFLGGQRVYFDGQPLTPTAETNGYALFSLPLSAPSQVGDDVGTLEFKVAGPVSGSPPLFVRYTVSNPVDTSAAAGLVWINPKLVGPPDYSVFSAAPNLCWSELPQAGPAPLAFRVMLAGPTTADSGWMSAQCWLPPALGPGTYLWKVFVRDGAGQVNRTDDLPHIFIIK